MNTLNHTNTISLKQLREQFPKYIEAINNGQSFTVVKRSKPIFQISPIADEGQWTTIIDFTELVDGGIPASDVLKALE